MPVSRKEKVTRQLRLAGERLAQQQDRKDKQAAEAAATAAAAAQRPSLVERDRMVLTLHEPEMCPTGPEVVAA